MSRPPPPPRTRAARVLTSHGPARPSHPSDPDHALGRVCHGHPAGKCEEQARLAPGLCRFPVGCLPGDGNSHDKLLKLHRRLEPTL
jgi:hypothetical protein